MAYVKGSTADSPVISLGKLGFIEIRDSLREYLKSSEVFTDYDFEGSALSTLIDLLSYNSTFYSYYANMVANESFLDTATRSSSLGSLVKPLSYVPVSRRGARAEVNMVNSSDAAVTIRYGQGIFGGGFNWTPTQTYSIQPDTTTRISIIQGNRVEIPPEQSIVDTSIQHQRFRIPNKEVDTTTLDVYVNEGKGFNKWRAVETGSIAGVTAGEKVYFLTTSFDGGYEIYFGDGVVGKSPVHNSEISFDYLISAGAKGNGIATFTTSIPDVNVSGTVIASHSGSNDESPESIRTYAPSFFQSQGRAVTSNDFESLLRQERSGIISKIWGGEDNDPPQYGRVFVSAIAEDGQYLTQEQKNDVINFFKSKAVVSILPEFVDPQIINVNLAGEVTIDLRKTSATLEEIVDLVVSFINNYQIGNFNSTFDWNDFYNKLFALDAGFDGEQISVRLSKRINASPSNPKNAITVRFSNPLEQPGIVGDVVWSTPFDCTTDQGVQFCLLQSTPEGIIELWTYSENAGGNRGVKVDSNVGSFNITTGAVQIDGVEFLSNFDIYVRPKSRSVFPRMGIILRLVNGGVEVVARA